MSGDVPNSDELADLVNVDSTSSSRDLTAFSEEEDALCQTRRDTIFANSTKRIVVQHKSWKTADIFRSEPDVLGSSQSVPPLHMASSPPASPLPQKRKFADLDLGLNTLERAPKAARAQRSYYGIDVHALLEEAQAEDKIARAQAEAAAAASSNAVQVSVEPQQAPTPPAEPASKRTLLWTEKYRARKFTDLLGDERTHRAVMHWLKRWDQIVFPGSYKPKQRSKRLGGDVDEAERPHRKILMLTGPPGLGKTTLAHVCARQAGYEVQEINASDERSKDVVRGRIRDMVGTENVKAVDTKQINGKTLKAGRPVCVVVDEVDGVVSGNSGGGGEGGFVKALIDLVTLDQKNSAAALSTMQQAPTRKKAGDRFRLLRPLILICNDVYHPSLRPLRQSSIAEIIHVRKPAVQNVATRMHAIFEREGIQADSDGVRRLCEATWGVSSRKEDRSGSGAGEGDMRGVMVVGEWVAGRLRALRNETKSDVRLTRRWVEDHVLQNLMHGGGGARGLGRGGPRDIVERIFQEGAGFPKSTANTAPVHKATAVGGVKGVAEGQRRTALARLRELVDTHGDTDRIMTDCFSMYPEKPFQDDTYLSKPGSAYDWLHFHDRLSSQLHRSNEWELAPYLSTPLLAFHTLFASPVRAQYEQPATNSMTKDDDDASPMPFTGPQASWLAHEALKHNTTHLEVLHSSLSLPLNRAFTSTPAIATDLLPYLLRMLSPAVNPVLVGGSGKDARSTASVRKANEQALVARGVNAMGASGVRFERTKVTQGDDGGVSSWNQNTSWIFRMEPPLDSLASFETGGKGFGDVGGAKVRFAVRQVLDQEWRKEEKRRAEEARMARFNGGLTAQNGGDVARSGTVDADEHVEGCGEVTALAVESKKIKRDFFGRPVAVAAVPTLSREQSSMKGRPQSRNNGAGGEQGRVWVTYHEGFSNAVRKPITLAELMKDL